MSSYDIKDTNRSGGDFPHGYFERSYNYPEQLLPTHVTNRGLQLLKNDFGLPDHFIDGLRILTASFRYDRCVDKCVRLTQNKSYHYKDTYTNEFLVIPEAEEYVQTLDGQCGNLAVKWIKFAHNTGWIDDVNAFLKSHNERPLHILHIKGYAKTHFVDGSSNHVWAGLSQNSSIIVPNSTVLIDPSFQIITTDDESAYKMDINRNTIDPKQFVRSTSRTIKIGEYNPDDNSHSEKAIVLGISADRAFSLGIGFSHMKSQDQRDLSDISPFVRIGDEQDNRNYVSFTDGHFIIDSNANIPQATLDEAIDMIKALSHMQIVHDNEAAMIVAEEKTIINL